MSEIEIPKEIEGSISNERVDFKLKCTRSEPPGKTLGSMLSGVLWLGFSLVFVILFFGPIFLGENMDIEVNGKPTTVGPNNNLEVLAIPALIMGVFLIIGGVFTLGPLTRLVTKNEEIFIGTDKRLIVISSEGTKSIDWEEFRGTISVLGGMDKGFVELVLQEEEIVRRNKRSYAVPKKIYIQAGEKAFEISEMIRIRIKENDPTPSKPS
jgi:hypothetical protein